MKRQKRTKNKLTTHKKRNPLKKEEVIKPVSKKLILLLVIFISIITTIVYYPSLKNEITNWDDDQYVTENPYIKSFSKENLKNIFLGFYMGNYHPLSMLSLNIDYKIAGLDKNDEFIAWIYHFTNVLLHVLNTLLVFWLVYLLFSKIEIAFVASLLFGVNTMHVESVAWISERKDVLYAFFFIASLISYIYYVKNNKIKYYVFAFILFILSLLSKGQAVSLAVTLIAIDYLFKRKLIKIDVIAEKIPFFIFAVGFGIIAIYAQKAGDALHDSNSYEFYKRIGMAGYAFTTYIVKLILPINLSAIYPYPDIILKTIPQYFYLYLIPSLSVVYLFFRFIKKSKIISFSISFFIINIVLLLQLIPVGSAMMADRYSYIPSIGFFILLSWGFYKIQEKLKKNRSIAYFVLFVYTAILSTLTYQRCQIWENSLTLWNDTIKKSHRAVVAWNNRGSTKDKAGNHKDAIEDFTQAIVYKPDYKHAFYNRGTARKDYAKEISDSNLVKLALNDFNNALKYDSLFVEAYHNRGLAKEVLSGYAKDSLSITNLLNSALSDYNKTIKIKPSYENAYVNRGVIKGKLGRSNEAIKDFKKALEFNHNNASAYSNIGLANAKMQKYNIAIINYNKAIEIDNEFTTAYLNRGIAYSSLKKFSESIESFNKAIKLNNKLSDAYYYRAIDKLRLNRKEEACKDFEIAHILGHKYAKFQIDRFCK